MVATFAEIQGNKVGDIPATDVYMDILFKGIGNSAEGTDEQTCTGGGPAQFGTSGSGVQYPATQPTCYTSTPSAKNACDKAGGVISGKGPFCVDDEEQASLDIADCYYLKGLACIKAYAATTQGSAGGGGAGGCCLMYQNALEKTCDRDLQEQCLAQGTQTTTDCNSSSSTDTPPPSCQSTPTKQLSTADHSLQKCISDDCDKQGNNALKACVEAVFKPVQACYLQAKEEFDKCQKAIDNKCNCKNCISQVVDPCADCPTTTDVPSDSNPTPVDPGDPFNLNQFKTNSQWSVIPRLYGRYVVPGNVIWVGNQQNKQISYTLDLGNGDSADIVDVVSTIDFIVGICLGPTQNLLRIWEGQQLIFNQTVDLSEGSTNNGMTDLDLSVMAKSDYNMARLLAYQPTIQFYTGSKTQKIIETYTRDVGFGKASAHRGLTLVVFRDVDLGLLGNGFPDLKFDVMSTFAQNILPNTTSPTQTGMVTEYMEVDTRTESVYIARPDKTRLLNSNTLQQEYEADTPGAANRIATKSGEVVYYDGADLKLVDPFRNRELVNYGAGLGVPLNGSDTYLASDSTYSTFDAIFVSDSDGTVATAGFDFTRDLATTPDFALVGLSLHTLFDTLVTNISAESYLYQFFVNTAGDSIKVRKTTLTDAAILKDPLPIQTFTIDPAVYGNATDIAYLRVVRDTGTNTFIVMVRTTASGNFIFKLDTSATVLWHVTTAINLPTWSDVGEIRSRLATDSFYFIDTDQNVVKLSVDDGTLLVTDNVDTRSLPNLGGAQFYEGANESIIYQTDDSRLVRIYLNRIVPTKVSLADVILDLISATGFDTALIDVTDVEDVTFDGYLIDSPATIADVINTLGALYLVSFTDNGRKISVLKDSSFISSPVVIDYSIINTLHTSRSITAENLDTASCTFQNIDDLGLIDIKQVVTIKPDVEETEVPTSQDFNLKLNDSPDNIRVALERILRTAIANRDTLEINLFPRDIAFCPRDTIEVDGTVYRVATTVIDADDEIRITGVRYDEQILEEDVALAANPLNNARTIIRPTRKPPYRPVVLFTNAINDDDVQTVQQIDKQIVYTGIEAPTQDIEATRFRYRLLPSQAPSLILSGVGTPVPPINPSGTPHINPDGTITLETDALDNGSTYFLTQTHTKALHSGVVVTPPTFLGAEMGSVPQFKTDVGQTLVIKFDFTETITEFVGSLAKYAVLELPTTNLLIVGREYMQFDQWSVDMDGLTVTFTRLYRGKQGTESYINEHVAGEKVYLYTADTFKTSITSPRWTAKQQICSMVLAKPSIAGVTDLTWSKRSDAGSSRPWPPVGIKMRDKAADGTGNALLSVRHRSAFRSDFNQTGGPLPGDSGNYTSMAFRLEFPTIEEFELRIIRAFDYNDVLTDFVYDVQIIGYDPADPDPLANDILGMGPYLYDPTSPTNTHAVAGLPIYVAIMELRGNTILGHPVFRRLPNGNYPVDQFRP